uniref:Uncharacterized protein n=1 Tax=Oryza brachyantha TaxID=4533 RepID=J3L6W2_ORYBR
MKATPVVGGQFFSWTVFLKLYSLTASILSLNFEGFHLFLFPLLKKYFFSLGSCKYSLYGEIGVLLHRWFIRSHFCCLAMVIVIAVGLFLGLRRG